MVSRWPSLLAAATLLSGCAASGTRPDDMSAEAHRKAAAEEQQVAAEHARKYDPSATATKVSGPVAGGRAGGHLDYPDRTRTYNPTAGHRSDAQKHREHAAQHQAAGKELERFEEAECQGFDPATRAVCPLLGQVASLEDVSGGVRLRLAEGVPAEAALAHIRCHLAFARTRAFSGMDDCPLYLKGLQAAPSTDGSAIDLTSDESATVELLRNRSRAHVGP
ncbi:MAG: hypothetical protein HY901_31565 [Deltaproteobacteria bacterium]|nr:hypothetical protein [Deltaproteobacteria bacterium]